MKVLQLIDSLEVGGAERVAVNIANALVSQDAVSHLCATRAEGLLKDSLDTHVEYLFLNKKSTLDVLSIFRLNRYVKLHQIKIIHAHSSSFFLATIIRIFNKNIKVVWHDHYGNSEFLQHRTFKVLKACSVYFNHIFCVNKHLEKWAKLHLKSKNISYLPNFAVKTNLTPETTLHGEIGKRIICLANLREQKDHLTLLKAFKITIEQHKDWTLHLIGKDFNDLYSETVKSFILDNALQKNVFLYGSKPDTFHMLSQATIGVLSSKSEGLPLSLLEYGLARLPVIATQVGECAEVVKNDMGLLVNPKNSIELSQAFLKYIENEALRSADAIRFHEYIQNNFSEKSQIKAIIEIYKKIIK
ncbi:glycosyltransferase [Mariniflexile jejuense]|uniref:Glycosyltransferase n=1 Tax=Mariniflexile jejuense TaxID=1173582 RepID=A0ABW3JGC6_9FLAO